MYYVIGNFLGLRAKAAIRMSTELEAIVTQPLLESHKILTNTIISSITNVPVKQGLLSTLRKRIEENSNERC